MKKKPGQEYYVNRHSCFLLQYHLVLITKFRNPVLTGNVKNRVYEIVRQTAEEYNIEILEFNGEQDHIHILFEAMPQLQLTGFVNVLKTRTARLARRDYPLAYIIDLQAFGCSEYVNISHTPLTIKTLKMEDTGLATHLP